MAEELKENADLAGKAEDGVTTSLAKDVQTVPVRGRLRFIAGLTVLATLCILGDQVVANRRELQIWYHRWQMRRAWREYARLAGAAGSSPAIDVSQDTIDRCDYHRQQLVDLGALVKRRYRCTHLKSHTEAAKRFQTCMVLGPRPECDGFVVPWHAKPEPLEVIVWCVPADAGAWDAFVAEHDVPE